MISASTSATIDVATTDAMVTGSNLSKVYQVGDRRTVTALHDITLSIKRGEFVAITGPSGSGKSTLLNLIATIDRPTSGSLTVSGQAVSAMGGDRLADFRRQTIGLVFQLFNLVPVLSALENVKLPLIPYPPREFNLNQRARELLTQVDLAERADHLPSQLSGGEQQRVAVARALVNSPALVLADEPTGNLDSKAGEGLMDLFASLHRQQNVTIIMVTHDANIASRADRIIRLSDGGLEDQDVV